MSSVLDRATEHFSAQGRKSIDVPEWGCTVYYAPLTVMEKRRIFKPGLRPGDDQAVAVDALIEKARDEAGKPMFTLDDRETLLRKVDAKVVERVALALLGGATAEETEKN
jgi:hypothetical protein